ncbi:MAG TPA: glutaredoxin family protein [Woeseiaceae bacterium]|jgi:hypothetical protein
MPRIRVYSRPGCHLCDELIEALLPLVRDSAVVDVCNVDTRDDWRLEFGDRVPVVEVDGRFVCRYTLDAPALRQALAGATSAMAAS